MVSGKARVIANEIIDLYQNHGFASPDGSGVSQFEYLIQLAQTAEIMGYDEDVVLAALLQDIGQVAVAANGSGESEEDYAEAGADYLKEKGFSKKIVRLVESTVESKRYMAFKDESYYNSLSESSRALLEKQGGKMYPEEAEAFEKYPLFDTIISVRKLDQEVKSQQLLPPDVEHYRNAIIRHLVKGSF
ncbi:MAG: HD domain-containing protein [Chitinophagaceae bacterium]|nr:MAG: HD domain-containing protein [Chitinophagaceae bacterium]